MTTSRVAILLPVAITFQLLMFVTGVQAQSDGGYAGQELVATEPVPLEIRLPNVEATLDPFRHTYAATICDPITGICSRITVGNPGSPVVTIDATGRIHNVEVSASCGLDSAYIDMTAIVNAPDWQCDAIGNCSYVNGELSVYCGVGIGPSMRCSVTINNTGCTATFYWNPAPATLGGPIKGGARIEWPKLRNLEPREISLPQLPPLEVVTTGAPGVADGTITGIGISFPFGK